MSEEAAPPPVPVFPPGERVCGNCKLWRAVSVDAVKGWVGECRVQPQRNLFVPTAPICNAYAPRGEVSVPRPSPQTVEKQRRLKNIAPTVVRRREDGTPSLPMQTRVVNARGDEQVDLGIGGKMTRAELMEVFLEATGQAEVPLAPKWEGGTVQLVPKDNTLQGKELPVDALFHKVVMVRDRLRTLEQKINAHPKLTDLEKIEMQQYVTRCYGSLTTFNVLFREKNDQFIGQKGDE
jgi:hypothetical protein